ncbi:MAG: TonB-dependent receptor [Sulfuricella sp.]|nr:TonB-dependent receptor [Sulfuricella sp.]
MRNSKFVLHALAVLFATPALADGIHTLEEVVIRDSSENLVGVADSANQGTVTRSQLQNRPLLRPGELLEVVPGLIVTQHSGDGKANQYFLRGFNLDHGTDFAVSLDGMPVNLPTHAHGQGWADMNFVIPELVNSVRYQKGPYYADSGDFAAAGSARIDYVNQLDQGIASLGMGSYGYRRTLAAASPEVGAGKLLAAIELFHHDGAWTTPEDYRKLNAVLRYAQGNSQNGFNLTAMAYQAEWNATDQAPQRAVAAGLLDRYAAMDPSDGGKAHRYSLSGTWRQTEGGMVTQANAYFIDSALNLYSNFTYFLDDPLHGDQFEQADRRTTGGGEISRSWLGKLGGLETEHLVGLQLRNDNISNVGLYASEARQRLSTTRADHVTQTSASLYYQNTLQWQEKFRSIMGLRGDFQRYRVDSSLAANSGETSDRILSPKLSLIFGPWQKTEAYLNLGYGFHSNDARGTVIRLDPKTLDPAAPVTPLVRAKGAEIGVRSMLLPGLQSALSLWRLDIASELLFVGDAGTTEASRPVRRSGIEWANHWHPVSGVILDADLAVSRARFRDDAPAGNQVPGAIEKTFSLGLTIERPSGWLGGLRLRYFGPRPLNEDGSVHSPASTLVNARLGYKFDKQWKVLLDVYNLFDRQVSDIDYYYVSRLPFEPAAGVADLHSHPAEPRSLRLNVVVNF